MSNIVIALLLVGLIFSHVARKKVLKKKNIRENHNLYNNDYEIMQLNKQLEELKNNIDEIREEVVKSKIKDKHKNGVSSLNRRKDNSLVYLEPYEDERLWA
ncbi:hypothetical protein [Clostridium magnum]|uniref:Uncharacterized protein n=1 Tax=Clostridium magnum DSM 2767 TaxID=1121326 RepID=A0A162TZD6_9CLOT|nr:hypothetical protein [Clostridium magnum]KZL93251.1 hypothetical protein CLMAG_02740 [Clostridium magnum DSM 2767]SHI19223.1 hypothetical protein SAMN02745944_03071 [Clostridium magnum DSM 2767]